MVGPPKYNTGYYALGPYYIIRPKLEDLKSVNGKTPPMWVAHMHSDRDSKQDAMSYLFPEMLVHPPPGGFTL